MFDSQFIPCMLIRGGTSKGVYFLSRDLPDEPTLRDQMLIKIMGSGDVQQINGIGGGTTLTSKVGIISPSPASGVDLDYLFAQVGVEEQVVDTKPSCGNILSGVLAFAVEKGLIQLDETSTTVRVRNLNTDTIIEVTAETPNRTLRFDGSTSIDGVPGTASPVLLNFLDVGGAKTGRLFPTGYTTETILGFTVSCVDAAVPMVHIAAHELGINGDECKQDIDNNRPLLEKVEAIRLIAGERMGLGDVSGSVIPKVAILSAPKQGGTITSRYLVPHNCHASHAVTGAICVGAAALIENTIAHQLASLTNDSAVCIEHPSGKIEVKIALIPGGEEPIIAQAALVRTARPLFKGEVFIG
ncbi:4-oxalomesaconate tautomerase [Photobacterium sp. TLY01]|uniref:4-oxalomesaconate tautomerase n=1 Tax=Photobacterium sp. TLY01 TaxID=2907534 RepID=UPI001F201049|nr:4-oxalomesaconate tautomerase [Photobacterium sp. TLY01]UIP30243.1 4-oxalomesaconate tautomerase [Photobacterium sp. TLY01]